MEQRKRTSEKSMILIFQLHNRRCDFLSLSCDSAAPTNKNSFVSFLLWVPVEYKSECGPRVFTLRTHVMISIRMHTKYKPTRRTCLAFYWNWIIECSFETHDSLFVGQKKEQRKIRAIPIKIKTAPRWIESGSRDVLYAHGYGESAALCRIRWENKNKSNSRIRSMLLN